MRHSELVCVKYIRGKGRGVFARCPIRKGTVIERVPVVLVPIQQIVGGWHNPAVARFGFVRDRWTVAVALGYGSLYNHSFKPNAIYEHGYAAMKYVALRNIKPGEEITINYNWDPKDRSPVGFEVVR